MCTIRGGGAAGAGVSCQPTATVLNKSGRFLRKTFQTLCGIPLTSEMISYTYLYLMHAYIS